MEGNESFVRRKRSGGWRASDRLYGGIGTADGRKRECLYEGIGAEDGRERIVCMVPSEKSL